MSFGDGVTEPRGVLATPDVQEYEMAENGAVIDSYAPFSYAVQQVQQYNGVPNAVVYSPRTAGAIDRLCEAVNLQPLRPPASFDGLSKFVTRQVPDDMDQGTSTGVASCAVVGDYSQILMALAPSENGTPGGIRVDVSRDLGFQSLSLMVRVWARFDCAILRPRFFSVVKGILAS